MKSKRKPGGGRKPRGPFSQNSAMMTVRMPSDLRDEIERSANKKGWSLSQELLWRLRSSYAKQREEKRSPATRAICFLVGEIARHVDFNRAKGYRSPVEWHRSPFAFRAFRLALDKLWEALEPPGDIQNNPYQPMFAFLTEQNREKEQSKFSQRLQSFFKTPEITGSTVAEWVTEGVFHPIREGERIFKLMRERYPHMRFFADPILEDIYSMNDVRRDLGIRAREPMWPFSKANRDEMFGDEP
jgi:hypothetical protein